MRAARPFGNNGHSPGPQTGPPAPPTSSGRGGWGERVDNPSHEKERFQRRVSEPCEMARFAGLAGFLLLAVLALPWATVVGAQDGGSRAALVVRYEDGSVETKCVAFSEPAMTGEELLQRSGLAVVMDYNAMTGGAVCSIQGIGCSVQDCFCRCQGADCQYWAYYHWVDGGWRYSQLGASGYQIKNGSLEGWSWGPGNFSSGTEPPAIKFEEICTRSPGVVPGQTSATTSAASPGPASPTAWLGYAGFAVAAAVLLGAGLMVTRRRSR